MRQEGRGVGEWHDGVRLSRPPGQLGSGKTSKNEKIDPCLLSSGETVCLRVGLVKKMLPPFLLPET